ncbi:hypothetical protein [Phaeodactylibacter sp.]|uniref:hypothetical protein n=1 Tax=Phaeodactylibacter sp. TaxID=1940289 RepID=UPI0025FEB6DC|nr:hypothetical protein [Phaeodactylibacter sp.]MCI4647431.1 hypothetical protein [Phaeodactylibacter sp.]MCI5091608.1 hypothetical protein [Phaeodactylibacter sp.]
MKRTLLSTFTLLMAFSLYCQESTATYGDQSPVVFATQSALRYHNEVAVNEPIPEDLIPLLAGLLITNKVDQEKSDEAIAAWISRYNQLAEAIRKLGDTQRSQRAITALEQGDFLEVESLLGIFPEQGQVRSYFPNAFGSAVSTQGNQSPVVYAEVAEISYVMKKVIHYHLPEQLSVELLRELKFSRQKNKQLTGVIEMRDEAIAQWVNKYREVEKLLANSPDTLTARAQQYFAQGKLDSTLLVLGELEGTKKQVAKGCYLQARIMMLRFSPAHFDSLNAEIGKLLRQSVTLHEEVEVMLHYGRFLAESVNDYYNANLILTRTKRIAKDTLTLLQIESELGFVQGGLQNISGMESHAQEALRLCDAYHDQRDTILLGVRNQAYGFLANAYFQKGVNTQGSLQDQAGFSQAQEKIRLAIHYDSLCLAVQDSLDQLMQSPALWRLPNRFILLSNLASRIPTVEPFAEADTVYQEVLGYMRENYSQSPLNLAWYYAQTLLKYGGFLFTAGHSERAAQAYQEAATLTPYFQPDQNLSSYGGLRMVYSSLVGILLFNHQPEQALQETDSLIARLDAYIRTGLSDGGNLKAELQQFAAYTAFRSGRYSEGISHVEGALSLLEAQPAPSVQFLQGYLSGLSLTAYIGVLNAVGAADATTAYDLLDRSAALVDRTNGMHPQAQLLVQGQLRTIDIFRACVALNFGELSRAKGYLNAVSAEVEGLFFQNPANFQTIIYLMRFTEAELEARRGYPEAAMNILSAANKDYYLNSPQAYRPMVGHYYLLSLSDLLILKEGRKEDRADWAQALDEMIKSYHLPSMEIQVFNQSGSMVLDINRLYRSEGMAALAGYYLGLPKKKRPDAAEIRFFLKEAEALLPETYKDYRTQKVRQQLRELKASCKCGL